MSFSPMVIRLNRGCFRCRSSSVLFEVFLRKRVLHLLEPVVVHLGRVDVAAGHLGAVGLAEAYRRVDRLVGVIRVVDRT